MFNEKEYHKQYRAEHKFKRIQYAKNYYLKHKKEIKEKSTKYYQEHKEQILPKQRKYSKKYHEEHKQQYQANANERLKIDIDFKILRNLRNRIWTALKRNVKSAHTIELIGCSVKDLKIHLEKQFKPGMNWDNYGQWHIDHICPCYTFDLSLSEQQLKCFNYSNLRPLWALDNQSRPKALQTIYYD